MLLTAFFVSAASIIVVTILVAVATAVINVFCYLCPSAFKLEASGNPVLFVSAAFTAALFPISVSLVEQLAHPASFGLTKLNHFWGCVGTRKQLRPLVLLTLGLPLIRCSSEVVLAASFSPGSYLPKIGQVCNNRYIMRPGL